MDDVGTKLGIVGGVKKKRNDTMQKIKNCHNNNLTHEAPTAIQYTS